MSTRRFSVRFVRTIFVIFYLYFASFLISQNWKPCANTNLKTGNYVNLSTPSTNGAYCSTFLLIVVISSPDRFDRRYAIRQTWARRIEQANLDVPILGNGNYTTIVKTAFLLGQSKSTELQKLVEMESQDFGDIVMGEFADTYNNLTLKTKMGLEWANQCKFQYLLKTDDDVFVNINGLVKWIWKLPRTNVYTGRCYRDIAAIRNKNHRWFLSKEVYPRDRLPPYCTGMGYMISKDVLQTIMTVIQSEPLFPLEDLYVGLMIEKFKIKPMSNFAFFQVNTDYSGDICNRKHMLMSHPVNVLQTYQLHLKFLQVDKCT